MTGNEAKDAVNARIAEFTKPITTGNLETAITEALATEPKLRAEFLKWAKQNGPMFVLSYNKR